MTAADIYAKHYPDFDISSIQVPLDDGPSTIPIHTLHRRSSNPSATPLLLVHGHPQNALIWRHVVPLLTKEDKFHLVLVDIRGHGLSGAPPVSELDEQGNERQLPQDEKDKRKWRYSKREMGKDLFSVMTQLGYDSFAIAGHDRGGRITHRMAIDQPERITKAMVLDIAPTLDMYMKTDVRFAALYWHWFFLIQPFPAPEKFIMGSPSTYLHRLVTRFPGPDPLNSVHPPEITSTYESSLSTFSQVHATCEDYRASAPLGVDLTLDKSDLEAGRLVKCPLRVLWGSQGICQFLYSSKDEQGTMEVIRLWRAKHEKGKEMVSGTALECGHYLPDEKPQETAKEILDFFGA